MMICVAAGRGLVDAMLGSSDYHTMEKGRDDNNDKTAKPWYVAKNGLTLSWSIDIMSSILRLMKSLLFILPLRGTVLPCSLVPGGSRLLLQYSSLLYSLFDVSSIPL